MLITLIYLRMRTTTELLIFSSITLHPTTTTVHRVQATMSIGNLRPLQLRTTRLAQAINLVNLEASRVFIPDRRRCRMVLRQETDLCN